MPFLHRVCILGTALLALSSVALGADYYVSPTGSDADSGAQDSPWKTIAYAVSESPAAPGDTIHVLPGTYEEIVLFKKSGSPEKPLILLSSEWGKAVIKGSVGLRADWVWLKGFDIQPASKPAADEGAMPGLVNVWGMNDKVVSCLVHDHNTGGGHGIEVAGNDCEIHGCVVSNNGFSDPGRTDGHGIYAGWGQRTLIENNIVFRDFGTALHVYGGKGEDIVLRGNICFANRGSSTITVRAGHPRAIIERNFIFSDFEIKTSNGITVGGSDSGAIEVRDNYILTNPEHRGKFGIDIITSPTGPRVMGDHVAYYEGYVKIPSGSTPETLATVRLDMNTYGILLDPKSLSYYIGKEQHVFADWQKLTGLDQNSHDDWTPGTEVFLVQNKYDPARFNLAVFSEKPQNTVVVPEGLISPFCTYRVENVRALGTVVGRGFYDPKVGLQVGDATGSIFNAYVVTAIPAASIK